MILTHDPSNVSQIRSHPVSLKCFLVVEWRGWKVGKGQGYYYVLIDVLDFNFLNDLSPLSSSTENSFFLQKRISQLSREIQESLPSWLTFSHCVSGRQVLTGPGTRSDMRLASLRQRRSMLCMSQSLSLSCHTCVRTDHEMETQAYLPLHYNTVALEPQPNRTMTWGCQDCDRIVFFSLFLPLSWSKDKCLVFNKHNECHWGGHGDTGTDHSHNSHSELLHRS